MGIKIRAKAQEQEISKDGHSDERIRNESRSRSTQRAKEEVKDSKIPVWKVCMRSNCVERRGAKQMFNARTVTRQSHSV
jgi:hypothetical protein